MRPYRISLAAGGAQDVPAAGSYVYAIATPGGPVTVHAYDVNGALVLEGSLHAGRGLLCPPFVRLHIENGDTAQSIEIQAGFGQVQDVGLVSVSGVVETAPDFSRSVAGTSFMGGSASGPHAAEKAASQIYNPAGSGKIVIVSRFMFSATTSALFVLGPGSIGNVAGSTLIGASGRPSLNPSKPVSAALSQYGKHTGAAADFGGLVFVLASNGVYLEQPQESPIALPPGYGATLVTNAVNENISPLWEFFEVPE